MIEGVKVKEIKLIPDERGYLFEVLRRDEELFEGFGQAYITAAYPGVFKALHYPDQHTEVVCLLSGMAKVVLYDPREGSPTKGEINEFFCGELRRMVIKIPPLVHHGYKNIGQGIVQLLNIPTNTYNYSTPDEFRVDPHSGEIPYDWNRRDG